MQGGSKLNIEVVAQRETTGIPAGYAAEYVMGGRRTWRCIAAGAIYTRGEAEMR
jgi:hypothetical protein